MSEEWKVPHGVEQASAVGGRVPVRILIAVGVVLLPGLLTYLMLLSDPWPTPSSQLPASFEWDLAQQLAIDPQLLHYTQDAQIELLLARPRAIATGPNGRIYVAGDQAVHILVPTGQRQHVIELEREPICLAVGGAEHSEPGRLFVGTASGIEVFDADHAAWASWRIPSEDAVLTSIAVAAKDVFVADAGNRLVWRFAANGEFAGQIGKANPARQVPGFVIPSPHFDVAIGAEGLLHIVNPGKLQITAFTFDGDFGTAWGRADSSVGGFFGCCNPVHIALLPDGRFVTSEKGIPRIKVYGPTGKFLAVVAGPRQLGMDEGSVADPRSTSDEAIFDITVDNRGRVLVLDPRSKAIRVFVARNGNVVAR